MLPLRFAGRWRTASIVLLLLVLAVTLMPAVWFWPEKQQLVTWFVHADKWLHGVTFVFLAVWFAGQYRPQSYWRIALGLLAFGGLIEICQKAVTYRSAELLDLAANAAGIGIGLAIALVGLGGWCLWIEDRFVPAKAGTGGA
ncbi:MAG: hypothetical protein GTO71_00575 [Woeseiaceae bacterium]|nr:hypothetical protein [Woeseiaceae bacterium]NIP19614.1 hypothetical protein [Woeseiaceae bacterium]NIS89731.1 hypothetical protein [Woeseiaceae bacterium]